MVFDLVNAGPRRRFTIRLNDGRAIIVSNCAMAIEADILRIGLRNCERAGYGVVMHCYDEAVAEMPHGVGSVTEMERLMLDIGATYDGLPLDAHGWRKKRYKK